MNLFSLFCLAVGLSMDAFSVAVCKGLSTTHLHPKHYLWVGLWFGGFQALMPTIGFFLAGTLGQYLQGYSHIIAFALLTFLGAQMIHSALHPERSSGNGGFGVRVLFLLALATSIDALAVGVTFALLPQIDIVFAVSLIGITTFCFSALGLKIGNVFGQTYQAKAELLGGVILIAIGIHLLVEHIVHG